MAPLQKCTLQEMLDSRDRRRERQRMHFDAPAAATLVVATVVAPGEFKLTPESDIVAEAMLGALKRNYGTAIITLRHDIFVSGHEIWLTLACTPEEAKRRAVLIEDNHMLGRLFDIDVILPDLRPLGRKETGMEPRRCLACGNEARYCMRARRHAPEEIARRIRELIKEYTAHPPFL